MRTDLNVIRGKKIPGRLAGDRRTSNHQIIDDVRRDGRHGDHRAVRHDRRGVLEEARNDGVLVEVRSDGDDGALEEDRNGSV